jgi:[ribosomal protein S5]-alanine N-acetyltransferase
MISVRPASIGDAAELSALYRANREFLAPWEPIRPDDFFTTDGQRQRLASADTELRDGTGLRCVIEEDGRIVGRITLSGIERGAAQSADLGYWVAQDANGRGIATTAVALMIDIAFGDLRLHRVQAGTLLHNEASQKVLIRNGFERIGIARAYLNIAGFWQDHLLFQRLADDDAGRPDTGDDH